MDILNQIVEKLNKEEIRKFRILSTNTAAPDERKDLILFDYIRNSGVKFDEKKALRKLGYSDGIKNSYYQLKNRLIENIGDSLVMLNTHKDELYEIFQYIQLSHLYRSRNLLKVSLSYLHKAERCAIAIESYEMLDVIYGDFIKLSSDLPEIKPDPYIKKRDENAVIVTDLREMDNALSILSHRLRLSQNFGPVDKNSLQKLQARVNTISAHTTSGFGKNLEARIYNALSRIFLQQHNYEGLEKLAVQTYLKFEKENWFDKANHELKLQMLTYCANALFKNSKNKESLSYAEKLGKEILSFDKLHFEKYYFFYSNSLVNNYSIINPQKGLEVLNDFESNIRKKKSTYYDFYIYLNRATLLYDMGRYKESLKNLVRLYISEGYLEADQSFKLKIEVCELIITFESGDSEALGYRLKQVKKSFASLQNEKSLQRDFEVIRLLEDMNAVVDYKRDSQILKKVNLFLKAKYGLDKEDSEIIKYRLWLSKKFRINIK
ncbi:MAG: hypothetical protein JWO03_1647 [Bacteroidetes bacterium]|nr:hypothetical protein [Bacteroidota bacterium]